MKKGNALLSVVAVVTITVFLVTFSLNLVVRSSSVYAFYFNDSSVVSNLYVDITNGDFAKGISGFFNSWMPDEFQIYEDTGYDLQGVFDEEDSDCMMIIKKIVDISLLACVLSLIATVAIYWFMIRNGEKRKLRIAFNTAFGIGLVYTIVEVAVLLSNRGRDWLLGVIGLPTLPEDSKLLVVLGHEFLPTGVVFLIIYTVIIFLVAFYANYRLTKPPRIFY